MEPRLPEVFRPPHAVEPLPQEPSRARCVGEAARRRIEVEGEPVGLVERSLAAVHDVDRDASEVDERQQRLLRPSDDVVHDLAGALRADRHGRHPRRDVLREVLLEEARPGHSVGTPFGRQRSIREPRQDERRDPVVEGRDVALRDSLRGPPRLVGMRDPDAADRRHGARGPGRSSLHARSSGTAARACRGVGRGTSDAGADRPQSIP